MSIGDGVDDITGRYICAPPNTPTATVQSNHPWDEIQNHIGLESSPSLLTGVYTYSPIIFGNPRSLALTTLELDRRLETEGTMDDLDSPEDLVGPSTLMGSNEIPITTHFDGLVRNHQVKTFQHPTHIVTRTVIRSNSTKFSSAIGFMRPQSLRVPTPVVGTIGNLVTRPTSRIPTTRPVSPLSGALKALKLITDSTMFEEDLDYYVRRWALEEDSQSRIEICVSTRTTHVIELVSGTEDDEDQVLYPRGSESL